MNPYLVFILVSLLGHYLLHAVANWLNLRHLSPEVPAEVSDACDAETYRKSQRYLRENTRFGILVETVDLSLTLAFMLAGGFNLVDRLARGPGWGEIGTGLLFAGILMAVMQLLHLPFSLYETFVIEERYGFNRTTRRTFALDRVKSLALTALIGGPAFAFAIWFFLNAGSMAWAYCWAALMALEACLVFVAPFLIMPLFNTFTPLEAGALRSAVEEYARSQRFRMKGVFTMDGSRRSAKTNAFFTGLGASRRIVLYDTLVQNHTVPEILAVVAHEMGHYRKRHVLLALLRAAAATGLLFYLLDVFLRNEGLFRAVRMEQVSVYASLILFGFLYTPVASVLSIIEHGISRRQEYAADAFAARTTGLAEAMVSALKKLAVDNLSNLTPHPFKVFLAYSHPPVVDRIRALRRGA